MTEHQPEAPAAGMQRDRDGYPGNAVWKCEGFWFAPHRSWGILGHRAIRDTAVLGPRLLRLLSADVARLADDLGGAVAGAAGPVSGDSGRDLTAVLAKAQARAEAAEAKVLEYENAITWNTTCLSCSAVLDSAIAETFRREQAEAKLAATAAYCRQHKGEAGFSWVRALDILDITGSEEAARDG